jgi:hypothetical protein
MTTAHATHGAPQLGIFDLPMFADGWFYFTRRADVLAACTYP